MRKHGYMYDEKEYHGHGISRFAFKAIFFEPLYATEHVSLHCWSTIDCQISGLSEDGLALRRAVIDAPMDIAPRAIFADWLEENGSPDLAEDQMKVVAAMERLHAKGWK
jgi:uncharacterized protein (TIGR02996 family)